VRSKEDLMQGCAKMLKNLRQKKGLSKRSIADELYIDAKTWSKYEAGESAPTVPEFVRFFDRLGEDVLKDVLEYAYPSIYDRSGSEESIRKATAHYMMTATEDDVRDLDFLIRGGHGSNIHPQLQEFVMIDHLPLEYRVVVAEMVYSLYRLARAKGELIALDGIMPKIEDFEEAIAKAKKSVRNGEKAYTTII